jgi:hypothetical protein
MVAGLLILASLIVLGVAAVRGWLPDTRDPEFSLGRVVHRRNDAAPSKPSPADAARTAPSGDGSSGRGSSPLTTSTTRRRTQLVQA